MQQLTGRWARIAGASLAMFSMAAIAGDGFPWRSGFESGNFREWNAAAESQLPQIVSEGCFAGKYCTRIPLSPGPRRDYYVNHHFGDYYSIGATKVTELFLRFHVKLSAGYQWPTGRDNIKLALINSTDGRGPKRRYQVYVYVDKDGRYKVDYSYIDKWRFHGLPHNVGEPPMVRRGEWDKIKLYVRLNTPGVADGIVRLWVNDSLRMEHHGLNLREHTDYAMGRLILSGYSADSTGGEGALYHDEWMLSRTDPDLSTPR